MQISPITFRKHGEDSLVRSWAAYLPVSCQVTRGHMSVSSLKRSLLLFQTKDFPTGTPCHHAADTYIMGESKRKQKEKLKQLSSLLKMQPLSNISHFITMFFPSCHRLWHIIHIIICTIYNLKALRVNFIVVILRNINACCIVIIIHVVLCCITGTDKTKTHQRD